MTKVLKLALLLLLTLGGVDCSSHRRIEFSKVKNPCLPSECWGMGVAEYEKGSPQISIDRARQAAIADLLKRNQASLTSVFYEWSKEARRKEDEEAISERFTKNVRSFIRTTVLTKKRFKDDMYDDTVVSYVCVERSDFTDSMKATEEYRAGVFASALDSYRAGKELASYDATEALVWFERAKGKLEMIGAKEEPFIDETGGEAALYMAVERQIAFLQKKIKSAERLLEQAERAYEEGKLYTARHTLNSSCKDVQDKEEHHLLAERIDSAEHEFRELKTKADIYFRNGNYVQALRFYEKAAKINVEDEELNVYCRSAKVLAGDRDTLTGFSRLFSIW